MAEPLQSISSRMIAQNLFNAGGESARDGRNARKADYVKMQEDDGSPSAALRGGAQSSGVQAGVASNYTARGERTSGGNAPSVASSAIAPTDKTIADSLTLSPEAQQQLRELQQRDATVRSHEQAHIAAGGPHVTGGASYSYQKGPDGKQYAIGGSVSIDTSAVSGDPQATKEKAQQIRRAALAPGEPSAQDQQVASKATSMEAQAASESREKKTESKNDDTAFASGVSGATSSVGQTSASNLPGAVTATASTTGSPGSVPTVSGTNAVPARESDPQEIILRRKAASAYADMSLQGVMPTALAPGGTGVSLQI